VSDQGESQDQTDYQIPHKGILSQDACSFAVVENYTGYTSSARLGAHEKQSQTLGYNAWSRLLEDNSS